MKTFREALLWLVWLFVLELVGSFAVFGCRPARKAKTLDPPAQQAESLCPICARFHPGLPCPKTPDRKPMPIVTPDCDGGCCPDGRCRPREERS
jgi:hypothetical protein